MKNIESLSKVDLHCHLDGCVRVETLYELLRENKLIDEMSIEDFSNLASIKNECNSLIEYLERFKYPGQVMQTSENLERITYELMEDMSKENIIYGEIRFAPFLHMEKGLSFDEVMEAVINGLYRGEEEFNIKANLILIAMRHEDVSKSIELVKLGEKYLNKGVVGFDIAGNEADFPPELHKDAFKLAKEVGYKITIHAGETGSVKNIWTAIDELGADRIGHGIAAIKDKELINELSKRNIALEMCPISNIQTKSVDKIENYPLGDFLKENIRVTVNTDNRTVSNTNMSKEFQYLIENNIITYDDIASITKNSIEAAFMEKKDKEKLLQKIKM